MRKRNIASWLLLVALSACAKEPEPQPFVISDPPSYMMFFGWDQTSLSQQALATINQVANAYKAKGNARVTVNGHTDTSGPASYNMALSLRRANAVKGALQSDGVPAAAIIIIGRGETQPLVLTPDDVREAQNRRVEIWLQ
jgi:OOP family OmpA-OmpF porin